MSSSFGSKITVTIFGESHGTGVGAVVDNLPAGIKISAKEINIQLSRRAPGQDETATPRKETDEFKVLSGLKDDTTTGAPLALIIKNRDTRSTDYSNIGLIPRPSHCDYPAFIKYSGFNDVRGSGHFSGRLTAAITAAGSICRQVIKQHGIIIGGHVLQIGDAFDEPFDMVNVDAEELGKLSEKYFSTRALIAKQSMTDVILKARENSDSVGGVVEISAVGLPAGIGSPMFGGVENVLSSVIFGIPAVKGVAFGAGFGYGSMYASHANDELYYDSDKVKTYSNNCGGISGGISNGMPLIIKAALKPTPSIAAAQRSINLQTKENTTLQIKGRHDPCIVPRALPAIEAAVSIGLINLMSEAGKL